MVVDGRGERDTGNKEKKERPEIIIQRSNNIFTGLYGSLVFETGRYLREIRKKIS